MIKKMLSILFLFIVFFLFLPSAIATTGFGPAEMYTSNQRDTKIIGNATLVNGDDIPKYGIFEIIMPYSDKDTFQIIPSEIIHARVLCMDCLNSMQRYEAIPGYKYGDPLNGTCTMCGGHHLVFYDVMPRDEYEMLSIEAAGNFHLEKIGHHTWKTVEKISPHGACNIHVLYDASSSYIEKNMGKHWEVHLRGKTVEKLDEGFMAGGIDLRLLITFKFPLHIKILDSLEKGKTFRVKVTYGPPDKRWEKPTQNISVAFNGIKKETDRNGITSFVFPETRGNYKYTLTAMETDLFLPDTKIITNTNTDNSLVGNILGFLTNIYVLIAIFIFVIICVVAYYYYYYY